MVNKRYSTVMLALEDIFYKEGYITRDTMEKVAAQNGMKLDELLQAVRILGLSHKIKDRPAEPLPDQCS